MSDLVETRVIEVCKDEWVVQFSGGLGGWTTFSDTFATEAEAKAFEWACFRTLDALQRSRSRLAVT